MDMIEPEILADNSEITINSQQIETLKKHFPQCFDKDGNFIAEKLNEIVSDSGTALSKESYGLNWLGKSYARLLANENPLTLLAEDKTHNQKPENKDSQNLLIKGDNLEVLKHLKGAYSESIKMIYIDPPYNTGQDGFVYQDDRKFTPEQLAELAGIEIEEAKRILEFTQSKANSHSAWLTFMYPRLYIARELLKDDGVIFISIDDNEQTQLKLLCDEVFGEQNFVVSVAWEKLQTRKNSSQYFSQSHEYILCYTKNKANWARLLTPRENSEKTYKNPDNDPKGPWKLDRIYANNPYEADYTITSPNGTIFRKPEGKYWRYSESSIKRFQQEGKLIWSSPDSLPHVKRYLNEVQDGLVPISLFDRKFAGDNGKASRELSSLLGYEKVMSYPKPTQLIKRLIEIGLRDGIVLDFFAGSGTTADAVMQHNLLNTTKLKFIVVQIDEKTSPKKDAFKAGFKSIFDITKTRIDKAAEKIRAENPDYNGDLGFQIFETLPIFEGYLDNIETLEGDIQDLFDGATLTDEQLEHLLTTWKVYDGIPLTQPLVETDLTGYTAFRHDKVLYLMHQGFKTESLKEFLSKLDTTTGSDKDFDVEKIVMFGYNFDSKNQLEINEAVRQYQNRKEKNVSVVVRY